MIKGEKATALSDLKLTQIKESIMPIVSVGDLDDLDIEHSTSAKVSLSFPFIIFIIYTQFIYFQIHDQINSKIFKNRRNKNGRILRKSIKM